MFLEILGQIMSKCTVLICGSSWIIYCMEKQTLIVNSPVYTTPNLGRIWIKGLVETGLMATITLIPVLHMHTHSQPRIRSLCFSGGDLGKLPLIAIDCIDCHWLHWSHLHATSPLWKLYCEFTVNFTIISSSGAMFTSLFHRSQVVQFGSWNTSVNVRMSRN